MPIYRTKDAMHSALASSKPRHLHLRGHLQKIQSVRFNRDGTKLAAGSFDKTARIWDITHSSVDEKMSICLRAHDGAVNQLAWNPLEDILATASNDRSVRLWDIRAKAPFEKISTPGENLNICWSPDARTIAIGNKNDIVSFVDTRTFKILHNLPKPEYEINEFAFFSPTLFVMTTNSGHIRTVSFPDMKPGVSMKAHTSVAYTVDVSPKGRYVVVGSADATATLWDMEEFLCVRSFAIRSVAFSHDGQFIASGLEDGAVDIAHVYSGEEIMTLKAVGTSTNTVAWHPRRYAIAFAGDDERKDGTISPKAGIVNLYFPF